MVFNTIHKNYQTYRRNISSEQAKALTLYDHGAAFARIAFGCIRMRVLEAKQTFLHEVNDFRNSRLSDYKPDVKHISRLVRDVVGFLQFVGDVFVVLVRDEWRKNVQSKIST